MLKLRQFLCARTTMDAFNTWLPNNKIIAVIYLNYMTLYIIIITIITRDRNVTCSSINFL